MNLLMTTALLLTGATLGDAPVYESELIFPFDELHNHSSCIIEAPDGSLLACWYRGSGERSADDVRILGARKRAGQDGWTPPFVMADTPGYPDCNAVMVVDSQERLWMFWPTILDHRWESAVLKYRRSSDWVTGKGPPRWDWQGVRHITPNGFGERMTAAIDNLPDYVLASEYLTDYYRKRRDWAGQELYQRLGWMPRVHATHLGEGKWILPLYTDTFSISLMAVAEDDGETWKVSTPLIGYGNIQPSVVQRRDGSLVAMMRENGVTERIRISESHDGGMNWGPVGMMDLPNPGASVEVIGLANGHWALVYNDTTEGRHSLAVSISDDEGKSWKWTRHLERVEPGKGSFSYPSIIQGSDGMLHATYTYSVRDGKREGKSIKYVRFNEAWVRQ